MCCFFRNWSALKSKIMPNKKNLHQSWHTYCIMAATKHIHVWEQSYRANITTVPGFYTDDNAVLNKVKDNIEWCRIQIIPTI